MYIIQSKHADKINTFNMNMDIFNEEAKKNAKSLNS